MADTVQKPILQVLGGEALDIPPAWLMRQAGRYLPEYRALRAKAKDFLDFCYTPSLATEVTLQPIRRYGFDGAILFADILLILDAMGLDVQFITGTGPVVEQVETASKLRQVPHATVTERLSPVYETVRRVRAGLPQETTLIGFAGSPWTVGLYAIEGRGGTDKRLAKGMAHSQPEELAHILDAIGDATVGYLMAQVEAGAEVLMLFDSWAEGLPDDVFRDIIIRPTRNLVRALRDAGADVPIIGFPRGAGPMVSEYVKETGVTALGLDTAAVPSFINQAVPQNMPVQGHLDPLLLITGGDRLDNRVREIRDAYKGRPHIFNLGHGITPDVPPENVARLLSVLRENV